MDKPAMYTVGGTVQAGGGIYIKRKADDELLELCRRGEFAFILSSRQVGKSSLMVRTAQELEKEGIRSAIIDLSAIGVINVSPDEWYLGILNEIANTFTLETNIFAWWEARKQLAPAQRLTNFFRDVLLKEIKERVVLFFDEIDSTLSITFSDDFFATLRAIYNARSTTPDFLRLSLVLIGVATPSDLIADSKRTPFNIGHRVELTDFTLTEARPLAAGLGSNAEMVLAWALDWTGGHPYLTQRLCAFLASRKEELAQQDVAQAVQELFVGEGGKLDNNLQFVHDMLTKRAPDIQRVLKTYKEIRGGQFVSDDERSLPKAHLKIAGVVRRENEHLVLRNRIYEYAFDLDWIKDNTPSNIPRRVAIASSLITVIVLVISVYFVYRESMRSDSERAAQFESDFRSAESTNAQLDGLAGLFELKGETYQSRAIRLFNGLPQERKLALFESNTPRSTRADQVVVVQGLYQTIGFKPESDERIDELLAAMRVAMKDSDPKLADEITAWLEGRAALEDRNYPQAKDELGEAIRINHENPALYYDRARAYIGMGSNYYAHAMDDMTQMVQLAPGQNGTARRLVNSDDALQMFWESNAQNYPVLNKAITVQMALIQSGMFLMGSDADEALAECQKYRDDCSRDFFTDEEPPHTVYIDTYLIDIFEVTNALYDECVADGFCSLPSGLDSYTRENYYNDPEYADYPVINVSWFDANSYCEWREARLPTEAEWEKAARSDSASIYPWGNNFDGTVVNFCDRNCEFGWANKNYDDGYIDTAPVDAYLDGISPFGVYNMAGNVGEWVSDWYSKTYYQSSSSSNPLGLDSGSERVVRGGSWYFYDYAVRTADRDSRVPSETYNLIGFRCALSD